MYCLWELNEKTDYTGAWWQVYIIVGGLGAAPLMAYYWKTDTKFKAALGRGLWNPKLNLVGRVFGGLLSLMTTYTLFMLTWPFWIALPVIEKGLETYG